MQLMILILVLVLSMTTMKTMMFCWLDVSTEVFVGRICVFLVLFSFMHEAELSDDEHYFGHWTPFEPYGFPDPQTSNTLWGI